MPNSSLPPIRVVLVALSLWVGLGPTPARAQDYVAGSTRFIEQLAEQAIANLSSENLTLPEREAKFRRLFNENFAVNGIARFSLGRYWRRATSREREEYMQLFEDVIVATWAGQFSAYKGQRVRVGQAVAAKSPRADENAALVRSEIQVSDSRSIRVDWRVANKGDIYKIADVLVEGISMVTTQRDEFVSVIRANGGEVEGLLKLLREQHAEAVANENTVTN